MTRVISLASGCPATPLRFSPDRLSHFCTMDRLRILQIFMFWLLLLNNSSFDLSLCSHILLEAARRSQTMPSTLHLEIPLVKYSISSHRFSLPRNTRPQFSQVLCHFMQGLPFLPIPVTCSSFLSDLSRPSFHIHIFTSVLCMMTDVFSMIDPFSIALLFFLSPQHNHL